MMLRKLVLPGNIIKMAEDGGHIAQIFAFFQH